MNVLHRSQDCNTDPPTRPHRCELCALHMLCSFIHTKVVPLINTSPPQLKRPTTALESRKIMYVCKSRGVVGWGQEGGAGGGGGLHNHFHMDPTLSCIWITDFRHRDNNGPLIMKLPRIWNARELSVTTPKSPFYPSTVYIRSKQTRRILTLNAFSVTRAPKQ